MKYKAIIFDLDGTLADTIADIAAAANFALHSFGQLGHETEAYRQMIGNGLRKLISRCLPINQQHLTDNVLAVMKQRYSENCLNETKLYRGISETVEQLKKQGVRLAVLTNKDQDIARRITAHFFPQETFEQIVGTTGNCPVKPNAEASKKIIDKMGLSASDFLFIGDSSVDIDTASNVGVESIGVGWGLGNRGDLLSCKAGTIIDKPAEILDILKC